jgi:hypothetical protein
MSSDFRKTVYNMSRNLAWDYSGQRDDPRDLYPTVYRENLEEAFTAAIKFIHTVAPGASLEYVRSDMGGPIYEVRGEECAAERKAEA